MRVLIGAFSIIVLVWLYVTTSVPRAPLLKPCTPEWFSYLERHYLATTDGDGHGPDLDSNEWFSVFEAKAGLQETGALVRQQRCQWIQDQLNHRTYIINRKFGSALSF